MSRKKPAPSDPNNPTPGRGRQYRVGAPTGNIPHVLSDNHGKGRNTPRVREKPYNDARTA